MMISPKAYLDIYKNKSYEELLAERDELYSSIKDFENNKTWLIDDIISPAPDVVYQMELQYLAEISKLISEKFNEKYECSPNGGRKNYENDLPKRQRKS